MPEYLACRAHDRETKLRSICQARSHHAPQVMARELAARDMAAIIDMTAVLRMPASFIILPLPQSMPQDDSKFIFALATHAGKGTAG